MSYYKPPKELDRPIAWVTKSYGKDGIAETNIVREGMSRDEIIAHFPPDARGRGTLLFNRLALVKAIIYEAHREPLERGNVRSFWYRRIKHTLLTIMGESGSEENINSIDTTISQAWKELVEGGYLTYSDLNIYSEKERAYRIKVKEDSPYPTVLVVIEKESYQEVLNHLADTYEISFTALGGKSSRAALMSYVDQLRDLGIELYDRDWKIFSFCDFDPDGWNMPYGVANQLRDCNPDIFGSIEIIRVGVVGSQLGKTLIKHNAMPFSLYAKSEQGRKTKATSYERFATESGGLYINDIPHIVEMDAFDNDYVLDAILKSLAEHLDGFEYQVRKFKAEIESEYKPALEEVTREIQERIYEHYEDYYDAIEEKRDDLKVQKATRAPDERQQILSLYDEMDNIRHEIASLEESIAEQTADLDEDIDKLDSLESDLDESRWGVISRLTGDFRNKEDLPGPSELIKKIESNGGWRHWADDLEIETIGKDIVLKAGQKKVGISTLIEGNSRTVHNWIVSELAEHDDIDTYVGFYESPDEMIENTLNGEGGEA